MKKLSLTPSGLRALIATLLLIPTAAQAGEMVWQIGKAEPGNEDLALAPGKYAEYKADPLFLVGVSRPETDWPYVHPGPQDSWAGTRSHTATVVFGLKAPVPAGEGKLHLRLADTHAGGPPKLKLEVNGQVFERSLPAGGGDDSIHGDLAKAKPHQIDLSFPTSLLKPGDNQLRITTLAGSWMLYDWLGLELPTGASTASVSARTFFTAVEPIRGLMERDGRLVQPVHVKIQHVGPASEATLTLGAAPATPLRLAEGAQQIEAFVPEITQPVTVPVRLAIGGKVLAETQAALKPVRKMTVYILPHSHTDIGYTEIQTAIEEKQVQNLIKGIRYARETANYPAGAQFKWNVEVSWAADLYLKRLSQAQRAEFLDAVKKGWVSLQGMYLNELTGLCRPEELVELFHYSTTLARETGVPVDSVMISDVPGYTWASVTAMAHAGIRYFSTAPNYFDRIGDILVQWEDKPFYWVSPSGKEKVLVWIPFKGYGMSHIYGRLTAPFVSEYQDQLDKRKYPYDITHMRWSGHGDNAEPDPVISEFVKEWNPKYHWPRFVISSTSEAFRAFEQRYGKGLPEVKGDWTPYWEDGAGSSSLETAMNRNSSDRLTQAEALWAMKAPAAFPVPEAGEAWRKVLLYSEHTWGAWCSVSDPENKATKEQWEIKQSYALDADKRATTLLDQALNLESTAGGEAPEGAVDVYNTLSWAQGGLVRLSPELSKAGDRVLDDHGQPMPSQRLTSGELAFLADAVPPFSARRYQVVEGRPPGIPGVTVAGGLLDNGLVDVHLDDTTGAIRSLRVEGIDQEFVDVESGHLVNDYLFLPGNKLADLKRNGMITLRVKENGPLVGSIIVESPAPGCRRLVREVRLTAGTDYVELFDLVDKERAAISDKPGDWSFAQGGGKESVNFAFPFDVPEGEMLLDLPLGVIRPELDQMPSACKNWFTVGRWADVSNKKYGVTWVTLDAPLVQVGGITATLVGSQSKPEVWRQHVEPTRKLYSWAMNNHWGTNYRAYQDGPVMFRFILRPHGRSNPAAATRFATSFSQPLLPRRASGAKVEGTPRLQIEGEGVIATAFKPSDDGRALIVRLFGASGKDAKAKLHWGAPEPTAVFLSDTTQRAGKPVKGAIKVPGYGLVTVRAELPKSAQP